MSSTSYLGALPRPPIMADATHMTPAWAGWFSAAQILLQDLGASGTTSSRPTTNLYVGKPYFDTTLGVPIFLKTAGASPVWVNGVGTAV